MTAFQKLTLAALAAFCLIAALPESGFAGILQYRKNGRRSLDIAYERSYLDFNASDQIKANGWVNGIKLTISTRGMFDRYVLKPEVRFAQGLLRYDGPLTYSGQQVTSSGKQYDKDVSIFDARILAGYEYRTENSSFTPYVGLGMRIFDMGTDRMVSDAAGKKAVMHYEYSDAYLPVGMKYLSNRKDWEKGWSFSATTEGSIAKSGAYGASASFELEKRYMVVNVAVEPFIRYWRHPRLEQKADYYDKSGRHVVATITDPPANVTETGIALKLRF